MIDYFIHIAILINIYLILGQSLNLSFGVGKLFNLAHIASYSIGAYTSALLSVNYEFNFLSCLLLSGVFASMFSFLIGLISLKLDSDYFAVGTIAFAAVVTSLLINWKSLTNGVLGISGIDRPEVGKIDFYSDLNFLILSSIVSIISLTILYLFFKSSFGRDLKASSEYELAAKSLAKNILLLRNCTFIVSSFFAGIAGSLFAFYINYIDPSSFMLNEMIFVITIVIVGKPGSFLGCVLACVFLVILPEPLRFVDLPSSLIGPGRQILYALILFLVVYYKKDKLFPHTRKV